MQKRSFKITILQLGQNIKNMREEQNMSQEQLAEKLELSRTYVAYIETGARTPSLKVLHSIAEILHVRLQDLFRF